MPDITGLGDLQPYPGMPENYWISQPTPVPFFDGASLRFIVDDIAPQDGAFPSEVHAAVQTFLALSSTDRLAVSTAVHNDYRTLLEATDLPELPVASPGEIWGFVNPAEIHVARGPDDDRHIYLQIFCDCAWDIEHGLQLVYRDGNALVRVSAQDGHLTD